MMDQSSSKEDAEFQCVQNTLGEMMEKIVEDQQENFMDRTSQEEETSQTSEVSTCSKQFEVQEEGKISQKKSKDCKFHDVLCSMFGVGPITDENARGSIDKLPGHEKQLENTDYIPLSCPLMQSTREDMLSEKDKSFLKFLDDMQNLTTKDSPYAALKRHSEHQDYIPKEKEVLYETEENTSYEQMQTSNALTLQALLSSQESEHQTFFDFSDFGEKGITETQLLFPSHLDDPRGMGGEGSYLEDHSHQKYIKNVMVSGSCEALEENERVTDLDNKLVDNVAPCTEKTFEDIKSSQPLSLEKSCLDQIVHRKLEEAYSAVGVTATETETEMKIASVTNRSPKRASLTYFEGEHDSPSQLKYDKENQLYLQQPENQSVPNIDTTSLGTEYAYPLKRECELEHADLMKCSSIHDDEQNFEDEPARTEIKPEDESFGMGSTSVSLTCSAEHVQGARDHDTNETENENAQNVVMNTYDGNISITKAEHTLPRPEMAEGNHSTQMILDSEFEEQSVIASADTKTCSVLEEQHNKFLTPEDKSNVSNENVDEAQSSDNQTQENKSVTSEVTEKCPEDSWEMQTPFCNDQNSAKLPIQSSMDADVLIVGEANQPLQNPRSTLAASENMGTVITQKQCSLFLQKPLTIQQASETTMPSIDENTEKRFCPPSSHTMTLHDEEQEFTLRIDHLKPTTSLQNKTIARVSDQLVPDQSCLLVDPRAVFQEKNFIQPGLEESLYETEDNKQKEAKLPSPQFKWKYRPSCEAEDEDLITPVEEMEPDVLGNIQPLLTSHCSRSIRIGLSRKQRVKRLHKNVN